MVKNGLNIALFLTLICLIFTGLSKWHKSILLDELAEFKRTALEVLRQPLEDGHITVARNKLSVDYPAHFMLVAAMNPCPCGHYGDLAHPCTCTPAQRHRYMSRISGPLLDRIDIQCHIDAVSYNDLRQKADGEPSAAIRERVVKARAIQTERFRGTAIHCNAQMTPKMVRQYCQPDAQAEQQLRMAMELYLRPHTQGRTHHCRSRRSNPSRSARNKHSERLTTAASYPVPPARPLRLGRIIPFNSPYGFSRSFKACRDKNTQLSTLNTQLSTTMDQLIENFLQTDWIGVISKISMAIILGYLIGIERELHGKVVGTRTITLIAIGTTMYVLMSPTIFGGDNSRIIAQVVSGIGFLGAGIIFKDGDSVKGLTTAATVWCAAAVGGLCGFGMFAEAILGTLAIMMINIFFKHRLSKFEKEEKRQEQTNEKA